MNIGILTYYGVHNHGAVLQANALRQILKKKGHDCGFLEFERSYSNISREQANKYKIGVGSILFYLKYLREKGIANIMYNLRKKRILSKYRKERIPIIGDYKEFNGDLIVIGSDEVFGLDIGVNPFLYGNDLKSSHIISYAASFGSTTLDDIEKQGKGEMISTGLHKMDAVSVRDNNSLQIVESVSGIAASLTCDPVILYGYTKEINAYKPSCKKYILVYSYDKNLNDDDEIKPIMLYAKKRGLEILSLGYFHKWCKNINATPLELLGWIKNANLVVTDTFHGTVMSIICNTPMVVKLRDNKNKLFFLLSEYGLEDRVTQSFLDIENVANIPIDFSNVNKKITERRKNSMEYLNEALSKCQRTGNSYD